MAPSLFTAYQTDTQSETDGVWMPGFRGEIEVRIRSTHSKPAKEAQRKIEKRNRKYFQIGETVPPDVQEKNDAELACALVVDWRGAGMVDATGNPIACTDETKRTIFGDSSLWEFRQQVIGMAATADNFRKAELAAASGNSAAPSALDSAPGATEQSAPSA